MPSPTITSLQNQRVKDAAKLRDRRQRNKQGRILIDGARELSRAIDAGVDLLEVFVCESLCTSNESQAALGRARSSPAEILSVTAEVFAKLAFGDRAEGVIGVARAPHRELSSLQLSGDPLVAVVEAVEKPGNLGAVLRSADAAGVSAVVAVEGGTDLYNPNVIRASLGTVFTLPVCVASAEETLAWLRRLGCRIFAARVEADQLFTEVNYTGPVAVLLGSEAAGLTSVWRADDIAAVRLPMLGTADSLNISTAAAVLFYEVWRQRRRVSEP